MAKVITFSTVFPAYHPRAGEPTGFVESVWQSLFNQDNETFMPYTHLPLLKHASDRFSGPYDFMPKNHTIRAGHRWKVGDWFSPRIWSGKPYNSKQIIIAPDIEVKKVWEFELTFDDLFFINECLYAYSTSHDALETLAHNDALSQSDMLSWFNKPFVGQIICWNETIEY